MEAQYPNNLKTALLIILIALQIFPNYIESVEKFNPTIIHINDTFARIVVGNWSLQVEKHFLPNDIISVWSGEEGETKGETKIGGCVHFRGFLVGYEGDSSSVVSVCGDHFFGLLSLKERIYLLEPDCSDKSTHVVYQVSEKKRKRSIDHEQQENWEYFNLTGDIIDLNEEEQLELISQNIEIPLEQKINNTSYHQKPTKKLEFDNSEVGYFYDSAWETDYFTSYSHDKNWQKSGKPTPMWIELAVAVDHTVISFHGRDMVEKYILALLNIVNAIYQDASLEANVHIVVTRLLFFEHKKQSVIRVGNAKKTLENVNNWNRRLHLSLAPGETHHDAAIWLTRADIGGPSGYAPIGGVCDPKRSCALNRDEGLTSAFIIAHEMAHIIGLSHDGDNKAGNNCHNEALEGSIMAPLVSATFHKFSWSTCSQREFKTNAKKWTCLLTKPKQPSDIILNTTFQNSYSMDEQCRMEFGEGSSLCRAFDITEPCSHLWCGHQDSPLVCKTKKGPPLEGTDCGFGKWCINGYCEEIDVKRFGIEPIKHNKQDGGWSEWSNWGSCSKSCGIGVEFRTRKCDNPIPLYGGSDCFGLPEEWRICNVQSCPEPIRDIRADQCSNIPKFLKFQTLSQLNRTWLPYESDQYDMKCKLICITKETKELYITDENLIDGTPCSYENSSNICIQGTCYPIGCDGKLYSNLKLDSCGVCGGNNTECIKLQKSHGKKLKRELSRLSVIPRLAREIKFEANVSAEKIIHPNVAFILKNRRKKRYAVTIPNSSFHTEIIEGAKFYYKKYRNRHSIWTNGPVLAEMVVLIFATEKDITQGLNVTARTEYFVHKNWSDTNTRYVWKLGGWGPCSASCGVGKRHRTIACVDKLNDKLVRRKHCSLIAKPATETQKCNTFSCDFVWVSGDWETCSATCGAHGVQSREIYCVPQSAANDEFPWKYMVSPNKCPGIKPLETDACNRFPCKSQWISSEWSQCSTSCGTGISTRHVECVSLVNETYSCELPPPVDKKNCQAMFSGENNYLCKKKNRRCRKDYSRYCSLPVLAKYCVVKSFKNLCCKSCSM